MATTNGNGGRVRATLLCKLDDGVHLYLMPTGLRKNSKGKVEPLASALASLTKGEARRVRKALRRVGRPDLAGIDLRKVG